MKPLFSPKVKRILKAVLVTGLLVGFVLYAPMNEIYLALLSAEMGYFLIALLLGFPAVFLGTLSTWILARRQGIDIRLWDFYVFNLAARFYGFFSPASILSTGMRWQKLSAGDKAAEALSAIMFTRVMSIFAAVAMGLFWAISDIRQAPVTPLVFFVLLFFMILGAWLIMKFSPQMAVRSGRFSSTLGHEWARKAARFFEKLFTSLATYSRVPPAVLVGAITANFGNEILGLAGHVLIARALSIPLSVTDMGWLRAIAFLSSLAPFTLAGGFGLREVSLLVAMTAFNISPQLASAYAFLLYARSVLFNLLCGMIELSFTLKFR